MIKDNTLTATFNKSARVISEYEPDLIFEQPRDNLLLQEFITYEQCENGCKRTTIRRKFTKNGDYGDTRSSEIIWKN